MVGWVWTIAARRLIDASRRALARPKTAAGTDDLDEDRAPWAGLVRSPSAEEVFPLCLYQRDEPDQRVDQVTGVAGEWLLTEWPATASEGQPLLSQQRTQETLLERLRALPEAEQRVWFGRFLAAAHRCDEPRLIGLGEELW